MAGPLKSIIDAGTKVWLDSIDPDLVTKARAAGATGATSNPIIVADLIKTGRFDQELTASFERGLSDEDAAWAVTDHLVAAAQRVFHPVWSETSGDDGYVSFELDPLLEDVELGPPHDERVMRYVELGTHWAAGHDNRMIKVPATPAGIEALTPLAAAGVTLNVTLIFSQRQYEAARDAVWAGAQQRASLDAFKSVYSVFISRVDVWASKQATGLSDIAASQVGLANVKRIWLENDRFWADKETPLVQEIVFASTGAKLEGDAPDKYIAALIGSGIQTNPPATNDAIEASGKRYRKTVDLMPADEVLADIDANIDPAAMESALMAEGVAKFADPHKGLLALIGEKRASLTPTG